jgi:hypothetical protein
LTQEGKVNQKRQFSDEFLNALVDDQLDHAEGDATLAILHQEPELMKAVCELLVLKVMIRHAYSLDCFERQQKLPGDQI